MVSSFSFVFKLNYHPQIPYMNEIPKRLEKLPERMEKMI